MRELHSKDFMTVVRHAPLVSIDLILRDGAGRVLLGLRRNAPARGTWFVPGGRIHKGERISDAFARICMTEARLTASLEHARLVGVFDHFYEGDNAGGLAGVDTQYVVLAFELRGIDQSTTLTRDQHGADEWRELGAALEDPLVHPNTRLMLEHLDS